MKKNDFFYLEKRIDQMRQKESGLHLWVAEEQFIQFGIRILQVLLPTSLKIFK